MAANRGRRLVGDLRVPRGVKAVVAVCGFGVATAGLVVGIPALSCSGIGLVGLLLVPHPEVFLTLFVFAGLFKAHPALRLPFGFDWTAVLGLAAVAALSLQAALTRKGRFLAFCSTDLFLGGLGVALCVGLLYSRDVDYGSERVLEFLFLGVLASYFLPRLIGTFSSPAKVVRNVLLTIVVFATVLTLATLLGLGTSTRAFGGSYLSWAYFLGIAFIAGLSLMEISGRRWLRVVIALLLPLFLFSIAGTKARGPVISLAVVEGVLLFTKGRISLPKKAWAVIVTVVVFVGLYLTPPSVLSRFSLPAVQPRYSLVLASDRGASIKFRLDAWNLAGKLFAERPVSGTGTGSFRFFSNESELGHDLSYPHNALMQVISENGLIGLFFYLGWLGSLYLLYMRASHAFQVSKVSGNLLYGMLLVFLFLLVGSMFSGGAIAGRGELLAAGLIVLLASARNGRRKTALTRALQHSRSKIR